MTDLFQIKEASQRTGLSTHVIRVWERRYKAIEPSRTKSNRRLYSAAEIERLRLLRQVTDHGHAIGKVARLSNEQLVQLISSEVTPGPRPGRRSTRVASLA